jgi:hypothetical protein
VLTTGQPNLDFTYTSGGTCTVGSVDAANSTCTVDYIFTPRAPGQRLGAVQLVDSTGTVVLGTTLLGRTGTGPAVTFPGDSATKTLGSGFSTLDGVAVDAARDVYVADSGKNAIEELVAVGGSVPASNPTIRTLGSGFSSPMGAVVDGAGNVYVADSGNSAVKEIMAVGGTIPSSNPIILTYTGTGVLQADQYGNNIYARAPSVQSTVTLQDVVANPAGTEAATVTITNAGTLGSIYVLTTGTPNLDYTFVSGGTCVAGTAYVSNATCTVEYVFTAKAPGQRLGAVQLVDCTGTVVLGITLLTETGTGATVVFRTTQR